MHSLRTVWIYLCVFFPVAVISSIAISNILLVLCVIGFFFFQPKENVPTNRIPIFLFIVLLIIQTISIFLSPISSNWSSWFEESSVYLALLVGFVVGRDFKRVQFSFRWALFILLPICIYSVFQFYYGWDLLRGMKPLLLQFHRYHAIGLQDFHLTFAGILGLLFPFLFVVFSSIPLSILTGIGSLFGVLSTMARSVMIGIVSSILIFLFWGVKKHRILSILLMILLIFLSVTFFAAAGNRFAHGVSVGENQQPAGDPTRFALWSVAIKIIQEFPVFGIGNDNWKEVFETYRNPTFPYSTTAHPHNDFISIAVDYGVLAGVVFILFWIFVLFRLARNYFLDKTEKKHWFLAFFASIASILIGGLFQNFQTDAETSLLLWFITGVALKFEEVRTE